MTTIRDVARRAGVAPITASRALSGSGYVSPKTRARVEAAAAELHYIPNMLAHSLRSNRTHTLALLLTDITNPFWTTVARGVEDEAAQHGYTVIFGNTDEDPAKQANYLAMLLRRRVDGLLLVPAGDSAQPLHDLQAQHVPVVVLDRQVARTQVSSTQVSSTQVSSTQGEDAAGKGHAGENYAGEDDAGESYPVDIVRGSSLTAARRLVEHLLDLGHRRIAVLSGPASVSTARERVDGYRAALHAAGLPTNLPADEALVFFGAYTVESGLDMACRALALTPRPTALFAANNFIAVGALRALHASGLAVPADISLVSFDDLPFSYTREPFLTVAAQPAYELGATAARRLLARLAGAATGPSQEIVLPTELVIRSSTAPPRRT